MALEAVVYQQELFSHNGKDLHTLLEDEYFSFNFLQNQAENFFYDCSFDGSSSSPPLMMPTLNEWGPNSSSGSTDHGLTIPMVEDVQVDGVSSETITSTRQKRRRARARKNKEEIENQRMTHIAVERNRRKQMNEYLSVLRSLMPESYVQRGDQASIIGGAINFVKELEQNLHWLSAQKHIKYDKPMNSSISLPFSEFFAYPQYSTTASVDEPSTETRARLADIEVNMVESHAHLKIRSKRRPKQLLKMVSGLQSLRLIILHLNVTTADEVVLYTFNVKVEDDSKMTSVDEIATAVYQMMGRIQEETNLN